MSQISAGMSKISKLQIPALLMGLMGCGVSILLYNQNPETTLHSYFFSYIFWICLTLGCFGLTILHHTVRGSWGLSILRVNEAGGGALNFILMGLLFLPIVFNMPVFFEWTHADVLKHDPVLQHKSSFLNTNGFILRSIVYFLIWIIMASILRKSSNKQDQNNDINEQHKRTNISSPGIVIFVLTLTFAFTDWVMSLSPHWFSTIYGIWFMVGQGVMALAFGTFIVTRYSNLEPYKDVVRPALTKDLGNMIFVFTMLWAYFTLSQFIITWHGDLPEFTSYYNLRNQSFWIYLGAFNILGSFFLPWISLLSPRAKAVPKLLMMITVWVFFMRIIDLYWNIMPMFRITAPQISDLTMWIGIGGIWIALFIGQLKKSTLLPKHDLRLLEAAAEHHE